MNQSTYQQILADGLDELAAGGTPRDIARRHPEVEQELLRALLLAEALPQLGAEPSRLVEARSRRALLDAAEWHRPERATWLPRLSFQLPAVMPLVALTVLVLAALVLGAARQALPGDALYGAKLQIEAVQRSIASDADAVEAAQQAERIAEVRQLVVSEQAQSVRFEGEVEAVAPGMLQVAGIDVWLTGATVVIGEPALGRTATVSGLTGVAGVTAGRVEVAPAGRTRTPAEQEPDPAEGEPSPTETPEPTPDITPSQTVERTPAVTPTAPPAPTLQPTPDPSPAVAPPQPTATPDDDHSDDDGGDRSGPGGGSDDSGNDDSGSGSGGSDDHSSGGDDEEDPPDDDETEEPPDDGTEEPDD